MPAQLNRRRVLVLANNRDDEGLFLIENGREAVDFKEFAMSHLIGPHRDDFHIKKILRCDLSGDELDKYDMLRGSRLNWDAPVSRKEEWKKFFEYFYEEKAWWGW